MTIQKNVAGQFLYLALIKAADGSALTGATITGYRSIDGAAQATITGTITELANGQYKVALSQADTNGNNIGYFFTATSAVPIGYSIFTTAANPTDGVRLGLTALPNAAAQAAGGLYTQGSGAGQINQSANGQIDVNLKTVAGTSQTARDLGAALPAAAPGASGGLPTVNASNQVIVQAGLHKNTAFSNFLFLITDSTTHQPKTGLIDANFSTKTVSLDGAASTTIAGTITEVDSGFYKVNLLAAETNGNNLAFKFQATASDPTIITVVTGT